MSDPPSANNIEHLTGRRYVTLLLRLSVDTRGQAIQGELVDLESTTGKRFAGWRGLVSSVRAFLAELPPESRLTDD